MAATTGGGGRLSLSAGCGQPWPPAIPFSKQGRQGDVSKAEATTGAGTRALVPRAAYQSLAAASNLGCWGGVVSVGMTQPLTVGAAEGKRHVAKSH